MLSDGKWIKRGMKISRDQRVEQLYRQYSLKLFKMCDKYVGYDRRYSDLIEDCIQETFFALANELDRLGDHPSIEGWLVVTCQHRLWNALEDDRQRRKYTDLSVDPMADNIPLPAASDIDRWIDDETAVYEKERILSLLNEHQQVVFLRYTDGGYKVEEIADETGMSKSAVKSIMARIRRKIKKSGMLVFKD